MSARAWITPTTLFLAATLGACASMRSSSGASNLAGQYAYTTTAHGQPVNGTITIARSQAQYTIVMTSGGFTRDITFTDVSITGNRLSATAQTTNGDQIELRLTVTGNTITGGWAVASQNAELRGTRISDAPK
jgi:amino acid transporter